MQTLESKKIGCAVKEACFYIEKLEDVKKVEEKVQKQIDTDYPGFKLTNVDVRESFQKIGFNVFTTIKRPETDCKVCMDHR